jgi:hypothetical protein
VHCFGYLSTVHVRVPANTRYDEHHHIPEMTTPDMYEAKRQRQRKHHPANSEKSPRGKQKQTRDRNDCVICCSAQRTWQKRYKVSQRQVTLPYTHSERRYVAPDTCNTPLRTPLCGVVREKKASRGFPSPVANCRLVPGAGSCVTGTCTSSLSHRASPFLPFFLLNPRRVDC